MHMCMTTHPLCAQSLSSTLRMEQQRRAALERQLNEFQRSQRKASNKAASYRQVLSGVVTV